MAKPPKDARTFAEWWQPAYGSEHRVVVALVGFLLGAVVWPLVLPSLPSKQGVLVTLPAEVVRGASDPSAGPTEPPVYTSSKVGAGVRVWKP